jgi:putative flippase GtrA
MDIRAFLDKTDSSSQQFLRGVLASNVSFLLDFGLCLLLVGGMSCNYLAATALSFTAGTGLNYLLSTSWVFRCINGRRKRDFLFFIIVSAIGLGLNGLGMYLLTGLAHLHYLISRVASASLVFAFSFLARKSILAGALARATAGRRPR